MRTERFDLFRYQLLPVSRRQLTLPAVESRGPKTPDEARERKNEFFSIAVRELPELRHRQQDLVKRSLHESDDLFVFRLGAPKSVQRITRDLEAEKLPDYPNVIIAINNDPDVQLIAISQNIRAFSSSTVPIKLLDAALTGKLADFGLDIHIEALFDERDFWGLARKHRGRITKAKFELISPNMANISGALKLDLDALATASNSHQSDLELNSPTHGALELDEDNELLQSLVAYASKGGGNISLKVRGVKKRIKTKRSTRTVEIDEIEIEGSAPEVREAFKGIFQ